MCVVVTRAVAAAVQAALAWSNEVVDKLHKRMRLITCFERASLTFTLKVLCGPKLLLFVLMYNNGCNTVIVCKIRHVITPCEQLVVLHACMMVVDQLVARPTQIQHSSYVACMSPDRMCCTTGGVPGLNVNMLVPGTLYIPVGVQSA